MAKIPTGNFGFRTPQGGDITPTARVDTQATDAATRLGQQVTGIAGQQLHRLNAEAEQQAREDERRAKEAENMQVMLAHANIQNGLADAYRTVDQEVMDGKVDKIAGTAAWGDAAGKVISEATKGLPPERAQLLTAQTAQLRGRFEGSLMDTFRKKDQQDVAAGMVTMREQLERFASTDPAGAVKQYSAAVDLQASAAGWTPEKAAKEKATFTEGVAFNQFRRAGQQAVQADSIEALDEVQKRLAGPEGDALDPARRNQLDQTIFGWKASIEARREREANKAERALERQEKKASTQLDKAETLAMNGEFMSPEFIAQTSAMVQGTGLEERWRSAMESQKTIAGFASRPPAERAAILNGSRARAADPMVGTDPKTSARLNKAEEIDQALRRRVADGEAWEAAQSVGVVRTAPQLDISNPQQTIQVIGQRMAEIDVVEDWAGQKVSPLQPAEADAVGRMLKTLKPEQASSMLGQLGGLVNDAERVAALARQIDKKDETLGMAMLYANSKTTEGRYTAQLVLEGAQAIKDKVVKVDGAAETGWRAEIAQKVRGAYSNADVESRMIESAFMIAAAKQGDTDNAINLATGGIIERNGAKLPLPYGMKEREFGKRIEGVTPQMLADQVPGGAVMAGPARVPLADFVKTLPAAKLVHAGQGLYNVQAGNTLVTNERGQRITIKVAP